ncbi:urokinase plasminogen activator surface receptor-like [Pseudorasbora parva]|uniref:urokinase plasminogen activator surface receptor-like n=1 Tax=Pseudorasbora parva TaxID=51549 RepID=UPI00351E3994
MDLPISVFLLFILFTAGHTLNCNQCPGVSSTCVEMTCPNGYPYCVGTSLYVDGINTATAKNCAPANGCPSGSINLGIGGISSYCCSTDLCNKQNAPDPSSNTNNGNKCYFCDFTKNCSNTVSCSGTEDLCIKATGNIGGLSLPVKGCASKLVCDSSSLIPNLASVSCCKGNLCNGAQSVTQSFLFLCGSLLSYFLLH